MKEAKKKRVLIIEDEETNLLVGAMLIEAIGDFEAIEPGMVDSPNQALEWINKYDPDIILLDMNYGARPKLDNTADGFKVIEALSENDRKKIIAVSGNIDAYIEILRSLGIRHFNDKAAFVDCLSGKCDCDIKR